MDTGLPMDGLILTVSLLLMGGILVVGLSGRIRVPAALLSLALGMALGADGLGLLDVSDPAFVRNLSVVALVVILFEGGLTTKPTTLRDSGVPGLLLASVGVLITASLTAVGVQLVFDLGWRTSFLLGAVVASTDAAVVFDLVRRAPMPKRLAGILEVESAANDPLAIVLTLGLIAGFEGNAIGVFEWLRFGAWQLVGGLLVGGLVGAAAMLLSRVRLRSEGLYPIFAAGMAGVSYGLAAWMSTSGFLAVFVTGLVIGAMVPRYRRSIVGFHSSLANGADIGLFLLLGLLVYPSDLPAVAIPALVVAGFLTFVSRPAAVFLLMAPFRMTWREKTVISWGGLRGAVPIVLATFPATAGVPGGQTIFNVVFFVVLTSALIQGTTTVPVVRRLGLETEGPAWQSVAGIHPLEEVSDVDLVEVTVLPGLAIAGAALRDLPPPAGALVIAVLRDGRSLIPGADTVMLPGDVLVLSIDVSSVKLTDVTAWARGESDGEDAVRT